MNWMSLEKLKRNHNSVEDENMKNLYWQIVEAINNLEYHPEGN